MFKFGKKAKHENTIYKDVMELRDATKDLLGELMTDYVGTTVGYLMDFGKTPEDVKKSLTQVLGTLQVYVQAEILVDRQKHGYEPSLADLEFFKLV